MRENLTCHTKIWGGSMNTNAVSKVINLLDSHNFVNRLDVIVKTEDMEYIKTSPIQDTGVNKFVFDATLSSLLNFVLQLDVDERAALKLITLNKDITHDNSVCITKGRLTLKLRSDVYLKSGLQFKLSAFSRGNKKLNNDMYIHSFDLTKFEENIKKNDKNNIRLLWFAENVSDDNFKFIFSLENNDFYKQVFSKLEKADIEITNNSVVHPTISQINSCLAPDVSIVNDEDSLLEILEWLSYTAIGGEQLNSKVDPYISRYPSMLESEKRLNLSIISLDKLLISSETHKLWFKTLFSNLKWFSIISYGVKNCTRSYDNSGEHFFVDDGTNDIAVFVNSGEYAVWQITDSGDPN